MPGLSTEEGVYVDRLERWLGKVQEQTAGSLSLEMLRALLVVAKQPGVTVVQVADFLGTSRGTASRQLLDLGVKRRTQVDGETGTGEGFKLVEPFIDPTDLRLKRYRCTPKGYTLARQLAQTMSRGNGGGIQY